MCDKCMCSFKKITQIILLLTNFDNRQSRHLVVEIGNITKIALNYQLLCDFLRKYATYSHGWGVYGFLMDPCSNAMDGAPEIRIQNRKIRFFEKMSLLVLFWCL